MPEPKQPFTNKDTWNGGLYELVVNLGNHDEERLEFALCRVWSYQMLEGCYLDRHSDPSQQERVEPSLAIAENRHLLGIARMRNNARIACGTFLYCVEHRPDWLGFYIPLGALDQAYNSQVFLSPKLAGRPGRMQQRIATANVRSIDGWLADLAIHLFEVVPFRRGFIGHQVLDDCEDLAKRIAMTGIPEERYVGYLWSEAGMLKYLPKNKGY